MSTCTYNMMTVCMLTGGDMTYTCNDMYNEYVYIQYDDSVYSMLTGVCVRNIHTM